MAQNDPYSAVGGSFTAPGITAVKINAGKVERRPLKVQNSIAPGDDGSVKWMAGNKRYGFSGRGIYVESATAAHTLDQGDTGTGAVKLGDGETWTGPAI